MENLALKTVQALHLVDKIESVKGGISLASQILKSCRSTTTFQPAFEKLSQAMREVVELNIAAFKADILGLASDPTRFSQVEKRLQN